MLSATHLVESRSYNSLGQLQTAEVKNGASDLKWKITNDYGNENNNGNLLKQWTETGTATYGVRFVYDAVNRIRGAAEDAPNESVLASQTCSVVGGTCCVKYPADGYGNLWTENKSTTAAGVTAMSQAAACYYANGNQKHWVLNDPKSRAEYDSDGKMVKVGRVTTNDGTAWDTAQVLTTFTYNGVGQRVKQTVTQGPAIQTIHYVYGLDGEVAAEWDSTPATASGRQCLVGDHLGSTRVRFDSNGDVLQRIDYEPFSTEVQRTGVSGYSGGNQVTRKFTGKERDAETGLDYFGARYMSAVQGRFTSPDPKVFPDAVYDPQSWNKHGYVRNNPLRLVDPDGEDWKYVLSGTFNAVRTNATLGIRRTTGGNSDFRLGQKIGDGISMVSGAIEMAYGGSTAAGAAALCGTGVGCLAGVPVVAGGVVTAAHGAAMRGTALANFMRASDDAPSSSGSDRPTFEPSSKHGTSDKGNISQGPKDGQAALDHSVHVKGTSPRGVGVDAANRQIVVLDQTSKGKFHGHVGSWDQLTDQMRNSLIKNKMTDRRGYILSQE